MIGLADNFPAVNPRNPPEGPASAGPLPFQRATRTPATWQLTDAGELSEIADFDDSPDLADGYEPGPLKFMHAAHGSLYALIENRCGEEIPEKEWNEKVAAAQILQAQQERLAEKLACRGIRTDEQTQTPLFLVDPVTGKSVLQRQYRRVNIFPLVAQARRARLLVECEKFMESRKRVPYSRFITVTNGPRIPLTLAGWQTFRARVQQLQERAGTFNKQPFAKRYGLELVLRATEFGALTKKDGTPWRDEAGRILLHPHLHCLLVFNNGPVPKEDWKRLLSKNGEISRHFGAHWDAGEAIRNLRECIKYPFKPMDLELLSLDETFALFKANFRLRMVEPLGRFRVYRRELKQNLRKIVRWRGRDGKLQLKIVKDWNRHPVKSEPGRADALRRQRLADDKHGPTMHELCGFSPLDDAQARYNAVRSRVVGSLPERKEVRDMIVARMAPLPAFDCIARPAILVLGYSGNLDAIREHAAVAPVRSAALRALSARGISVHTTHLIRQPVPAHGQRDGPLGPSGGFLSVATQEPQDPESVTRN